MPIVNRQSSIANRRRVMLLTAFGLGYLRPAPGTFGSLPPVMMALGLVWISSHLKFEMSNRLIVDVPLISLAAIFTVVCLKHGAAGEQHFGRKDASAIVADEVAGQSIALLWLPWRDFHEPSGWKWNVTIALIAFAAFRLMDISKPPPCRSLQRVPGGAGILADDLIAAVYALILTQIAVRAVLPSLAA